MKTIKLFVALCAIAALGVSCRKEVPVQNEEGQIVVPEGMKYVSFEVGVPTKINGNPVKWNSPSEHVSVLALVNGESKVYDFTTETTTAVAETKKISGIVDSDANLKFVVYPHNENYKIDFEKDPSGNTIYMPNRGGYGFSNNNGVSSQTPFACKIKYSDGVFSAVSSLQPLFSSLKVTLPERISDHISGYKDKDVATSLVDSLYITGRGILGQVYVDFSGDNAVTSLKNAPSTQTIKVELKRNTTSGLPSTGYYYIPIAPSSPETLDIKLAHTPGSDGIEYADYTFHFGANTFEQGKAKEVTLSAPYVKTAGTVSATIDGTTLTMIGTAAIFIGTKVTVDNYNFGFSYREKGATDWTTVSAAYDETTGKFTADETVDPAKTYEVKAFAVTPGAIKTASGNVDQKIEGDVVESKGYVPPIVVTIDKFGTNEYDGTATGGNWYYLGDRTDYTFPTSKASGFRDTAADWAYYANNTDTTPSITIKIMGVSSNSYYFQKASIMSYGGYFEFPGKTGYKITRIETRGKAAGAVGKHITIKNMAGTTLGTSEDYAVANVQQVMDVDFSAPAGEAVRLSFAAFPYEYFIITYTAI